MPTVGSRWPLGARRSWIWSAVILGAMSIQSCHCSSKPSATLPISDAGPGAGCGLRTCASAGATCGPIGDGCGNVLPCGACTPPQSCGGGGTPSVCGGQSGCTPRTCQQIGAHCGTQADGCGSTLDCGGCPAGQTCGGGGVADTCGESANVDGGHLAPDGGCLPVTCAQQGATCGELGDGCGGSHSCGSCSGTQVCGGAGVAYACAEPQDSCTPRTCGDAKANCGSVGDGCGAILSCGGCAAPQICGGGGVPSTCGGGGDAGCVGLCMQQVSCSDGGTTTLTGVVYAPTNPDAGFGLPDPLPNALVYVPNGPVQPFGPTVACDVCGAPVSGNPLITATTGPDGSFTLTNVPAGTPIPLVIQLGRWRRQIVVPAVSACSTTALAPEQTRMPRNHTEGDIPRIAMVTGAVDSVECVLRKMGIDDSEFTASGADAGRVQLFVGPSPANGPGATDATKSALPEGALTSNPALLQTFDLVILACVGQELDQDAGLQQNLIDYANAGGRVYATHYSYVWLFDDPPFSGTAKWQVGQGRDDNLETVDIVQSFPSGALMAQWLFDVGASKTLGQISLAHLREDFTAAVPPAQTWVTYTQQGQGPMNTWPLHYTFNTPVGADAGLQCGRVVFSDFHVEDSSDTANGNNPSAPFPSECTVGPLTAQEKILEFMLFDLSSCVTQQGAPPPSCAPLTCAQQGFTCGEQGDGCGNVIQCGTCAAPQSCGGGGMPGVCGAAVCVPRTCAQDGASCGPAGDGCGNLLDCGGCDGGGTCGGGGIPSQCGSNLPCVPRTCAQQSLACGPAGDGCGNLIQCGACAPPASCGGGGTPGQCGVGTCTPLTCAGLGFNCGAAADGCGGVLQCGTCTSPQTCGGALQANVCGAPPSFR